MSDQMAQDRALVEVLRRPHPAQVGPYQCTCATCDVRHQAADAIARRLTDAEQAQWRPIETAPKDGTFVLACHVGPWAETYEQWRAPMTVAWRGFHPNAPGKKQWRNSDGKPVGPTHWMPLPAPPTGEEAP